MADLRAILCVCRIRVRTILFSFRTAAVLLLIGLYVFHGMEPVGQFCRDMNVTAAPLGAPFLLNDMIHQLFFGLGAVALFSPAPFRDDMHPYLASRSGKACLNMGNMLAILLCAAVYVSAIFLFSALPMIDRLDWRPQWGTVWTTLSSHQYQYTQYAWDIPVTPMLLNHHTALQAMLLFFGLETGCCAVLGMCVYAFNLLTGKPAGLWLSAAWALTDVTLYNLCMDSWVVLSPTGLARLTQYQLFYMPMGGSVAYGLIFFTASCAVFTFISVLRTKRAREI